MNRSSFRRRRTRSGSVYVLVLSTCMLLTVVALGGLYASRSESRRDDRRVGSFEADALALAAIEHAVATLDGNATWQVTYSPGMKAGPWSLGSGTFDWWLLPTGGATTFGAGKDPVVLVGQGLIGKSVRLYSVLLSPSGESGLDVLRTATHGGAGLTCTGPVEVIGGPLSSSGTLVNDGDVIGNVEAAAYAGSGTVSGTITVPAPPKDLPSETVYDLYVDQSVSIPYDTLPGGRIELLVLSPQSNPFGAASGVGVYAVDVPAGKTLEIRVSRMVATLVVRLRDGADLIVNNQMLWEPPSPLQPILVVKADGESTVDLNGHNNPLSEVSTWVNFNPPGTPFPYGSSDPNDSDGDTLDEYACEIAGVVHVIGSNATTDIGSNVKIRGAVIAEAAVVVGSNARLTADPGLLSTPPLGYAGPGPMRPTPGTLRREVTP